MTIGLLVLAVIVGYIRKGRLANLLNLEIKLVPLIILSFAIQVGIYCGYAFQIESVMTYDILLHFISYIVLLSALMGNFSNRWFIIVTVGVVLNFMAIFLNGGKMPVSYDAGAVIGLSESSLDSILAIKGGTHQPLQSGSLLWFLTDIIPVALPGPLSFMSNIYSIGDFVIFSGLVGLIQSAMAKNEDEGDWETSEGRDEDENFDSPMDIEMASQTGEIVDFDPGEDSSKVKEDTVDEDTMLMKPISENSDDDENPQSCSELSVEEEVRAETEEIKECDDERGEIPTAQSEEELKELSREKSGSIADDNETNADLVVETEPSEGVVVEKSTADLNERADYLDISAELDIVEDEQYLDEPIDVDTEHQFIIQDGKIVKNPNYNRRIERQVEDVKLDMETRMNKLEGQVEELEMTKVDLKTEKEYEEKNKLQKMTDMERVELMKKMKERREQGYSLVEVKVGDKKINFWKKDL